MADREESIHIKIHLELTEEDNAKLQAITGQVESASKKSPEDKKKEKKDKKMQEKLEFWSAGNVGKLQKLTQTQFGNIKQMASNPSMFMLSAFGRHFAKIGIGIGIGLLLMEIVQFIITESMKAGRWLDRRFKRVAQDEILLFMTRKEQEELRRGFSEVRVTTQQGLRGGAGQTSGNLFIHQTVGNHLYPSEYRQSHYEIKSTSGGKGNFATDSNGNVKGGHRTQ